MADFFQELLARFQRDPEAWARLQAQHDANADVMKKPLPVLSLPSELATRAADTLDAPALDRSPAEARVRGFLGGALQGAASLVPKTGEDVASAYLPLPSPIRNAAKRTAMLEELLARAKNTLNPEAYAELATQAAKHPRFTAFNAETHATTGATAGEQTIAKRLGEDPELFHGKLGMNPVVTNPKAVKRTFAHEQRGHLKDAVRIGSRNDVAAAFPGLGRGERAAEVLRRLKAKAAKENPHLDPYQIDPSEVRARIEQNLTELPADMSPAMRQAEATRRARDLDHSSAQTAGALGNAGSLRQIMLDREMYGPRHAPDMDYGLTPLMRWLGIPAVE